MRNSINGLILVTVFYTGLSVAQSAPGKTANGEADLTLPNGLITDRLNDKQLRIWRAMEQVILARDRQGQPRHRVLHELYNWAKASQLPIYIEMPKPQDDLQPKAGQCLYEKQRAPVSSRLAAVTIRLYRAVIDKTPGRRSQDGRLLRWEGLTGTERYCKVLAHELAHARQAVADPEYVKVTDRLESLNHEFLRLLEYRLVPENRQSATKEMRALADRLDLLVASVEAPAIAVEQEVWRELRAR